MILRLRNVRKVINPRPRKMINIPMNASLDIR